MFLSKLRVLKTEYASLVSRASEVPGKNKVYTHIGIQIVIKTLKSF